jgi:hypothetical protein
VKRIVVPFGLMLLGACVETTLDVPAGHPAHPGGASGPAARSTALSTLDEPPPSNAPAPAGEGQHGNHHHHHEHGASSGGSAPSPSHEHGGR